MADAVEAGQKELERHATELESRNTALELQSGELAAQKHRIESFFSFGEALASESELTPLTAQVLNGLCDVGRADLGILYVVDDVDDVVDSEAEGSPSLAGDFGCDPGRLPAKLVPGYGLAGRAFAERRILSDSHGESGLGMAALGKPVSVDHELHVPLLYADRCLGVVTLACAGRPFLPADLEAIEHLADQSAVAVANALTLRVASRQATINRAVLDAAKDGIRLVDLEGRTMLANPAIDRITTEVLGLPGDSTLYEHAAIAERLVDPDSYRETLRLIASDPEIETQDEFEVVASCRSFSRFTAPVLDSSGGPIGRSSFSER